MTKLETDKGIANKNKLNIFAGYDNAAFISTYMQTTISFSGDI